MLLPLCDRAVIVPVFSRCPTMILSSLPIPEEGVCRGAGLFLVRVSGFIGVVCACFTFSRITNIQGTPVPSPQQ